MKNLNAPSQTLFDLRHDFDIVLPNRPGNTTPGSKAKVGKVTIYAIKDDIAYAYQNYDFPEAGELTDDDIAAILNPGFDADTVEYKYTVGEFGIGVTGTLRGVYHLNYKQKDVIYEYQDAIQEKKKEYSDLSDEKQKLDKKISGVLEEMSVMDEKYSRRIEKLSR